VHYLPWRQRRRRLRKETLDSLVGDFRFDESQFEKVLLKLLSVFEIDERKHRFPDRENPIDRQIASRKKDAHQLVRRSGHVFHEKTDNRVASDLIALSPYARPRQS
jgi:hypothetical protein